jgi:hypothetical protein
MASTKALGIVGSDSRPESLDIFVLSIVPIYITINVSVGIFAALAMRSNQSQLSLDESYFQRVLSSAFIIQQNNARRLQDPPTKNSTLTISESNCIGEELTNDWATQPLIDLIGSLEADAASIANSELKSQPVVEASMQENLAAKESNLTVDSAQLSSGAKSPEVDETFDSLNFEETEDFPRGGGLLEFVPEIEVEATVKQALLTTHADGAAFAFKRRGRLVCRTAVGYSAPEIEAVLNAQAMLTEASRESMHLFSNTKVNSQMYTDACRKLGVRDVIAVPVIHQDHWLGLIAVFSRQPYAFGTRDLNSVDGLVQGFTDRLFFAEVLRMHSLTKFRLTDMLASTSPSDEKLR